MELWKYKKSPVFFRSVISQAQFEYGPPYLELHRPLWMEIVGLNSMYAVIESPWLEATEPSMFPVS